VDLSVAEKRLLKALPADGSPADAAALGFASASEALRAAGGPERAGLISIDQTPVVTYSLSDEGLHHQTVGLPERRAVAAIGEGLLMGELATAAKLDPAEVKVAIGWLKRKSWAHIERGTLALSAGIPAPGADETALARLSGDPTSASGDGITMLAQRGGVINVHETTARAIRLTEAGIKLAATIGDVGTEVNQITPEFIAQWAEMTPEQKASVHLRKFDFDVEVAGRHAAKPHPLTQLMMQTRDIFWRMGFQEIAGDYVESAFWNMDALFIPQDHPAREMQDTFYLENPREIQVDAEDLQRGKAVHETGGDTGSTGWGGAFSEEVSQQALLRTHTTNTTIRFLANNPTGTHKVFGLGKVFRKETMDATHLPEFYQIEGIVTEPGATFDMLVGLCRKFFTSMGFPEVRFRPAYFPYTEPSMEIDVWYNNKWMELGGCGVFRPEVTEPLGVEHLVLAWGFGLERLAMMRLGITDIRDLYISDVRWLKQQALL
jgi:phenylalanyl-tRNA synthetase alpha chain